MGRAEDSIDRNPVLVKEFEALRIAQGLSRKELCRRAHVGQGTLYRVCHPDHPQGVSKICFMRLAEVVVPNNLVQKARLLRIAGIALPETDVNNPFIQKVGQAVEELHLDAANEGLLEKFVLNQINTVGRALQLAQAATEEMQTGLPPKSRRTRRLAS